jgi:hypothetical protein
MTNFSLGQAWVSRVTRENTSDVPVIGANLSPLPDPAQLKGVLSVGRGLNTVDFVRFKNRDPGRRCAIREPGFQLAWDQASGMWSLAL